jgi:hypothetical protein
MRNLLEMKLPIDASQVLTGVTVDELRNLGQQHLSLPTSPSRLETMSDQEIKNESTRAEQWFSNVLTNHAKLLGREQYMRMYRIAIEKELVGAKEKWSDMDRLYMTLTSLDVSDPKQRLRITLLMVLELNFPDRLADVGKLGSQRVGAGQRALMLDSEANNIRTEIVERTHNIKVDHFACAIPLAELKSCPDIVDDNEGCCPVCQNSYTDLSSNTLPQLLADYPVRIKHCNHVIGKACLEQWMSTPKIDEAKYPHRTCPLCRVKIEGVPAPRFPPSLKAHIKTDRRATETLKELVYGWDMETDECLDTIAACMSEEIACEELLSVVKRLTGKTRWSFERDEKMLKDKLEKLKEERRVWGFRGDRVWRQMRDEWMASRMARKE